jgi:O-acetylserine/cysteine efflux transporter
MRPRDIALACLTSVIWGFAFVAIRFGLESFSPPQLTVLRFVIGCLPMFFLPRPPVSWPMLIATGMFLFTGQFLLLFFAYTHGMPAGLASVTQQMQVLFTVLLAALFMRDRPTPRQAVGLLVAFGGLFLIGLTIGGDLSPVGLGLALAAAFSWAIGNVLVKRIGTVDALALMAWLSIIPPLPALLVSHFADPAGPSIFSAVAGASWKSLLAVVYIGSVGTVLAYAIWGRLLTRYPAAVVAPFALLAPCTGVIASAVILGERFPPTRYAGMALILAGLACILAPGRFLSARPAVR